MNDEPEMMTLTQLDRYLDARLLADCESMGEMEEHRLAQEEARRVARNAVPETQVRTVKNGRQVLLFSLYNQSGGRCYFWAWDRDDAEMIAMRYTGKSSVYEIETDEFGR